jgi:hypothetical protein
VFEDLDTLTRFVGELELGECGVERAGIAALVTSGDVLTEILQRLGQAEEVPLPLGIELKAPATRHPSSIASEVCRGPE